MPDRVLADIGQLGRRESEPVMIGRGGEGTVELDPASGIVCKQFYTPDPAEAARRARHEFDYLRRFSATLAGQPCLRCPEPVHLDPEQGKVWMTYCPGAQLDHLLASSSSGIDEHLDHIASQIALAIESYTTEFDEPNYSINPWNMLYDMPTRTLYPIDLTSTDRDPLRHITASHPPLDVTLGKLIGASIYDSVRPAKWRNRTYWTRQQRLMDAVLTWLSGRHNLDLPLVRNVSQAAYGSRVRSGSPTRRLWYATLGQVCFNSRNNAIIAQATLWAVAKKEPMSERVLADIGQLGQQATAPAPVEIGRGYHGAIELDPASGIVCKQFYMPDKGEAAELARREFDYLRRFSAALAGQPYLRCPQPVRVDLGLGKVWMTYCPGSPLNETLATASAGIDAHLGHIAEQIAIALEIYVAEFNEPYYDLATKHVLYDVPTRTLNLIDFTSRRRFRQAATKHAPFETSLGIFIGLSIRESIRPATWRNQAFWKPQERISIALLARLNARHELSLSLIQQISHDVYTHGVVKGRPLRRLWYGTAGQTLFNRRSKAIVAGLARGLD